MTTAHRTTASGLEVRYDRNGFEWVTNRDGDQFYITDCCDASAKGGEHGTVCRRCYRSIDPSLGGIPEPFPEDDSPTSRESRERFDRWNKANMPYWLGKPGAKPVPYEEANRA